MIVLLAKAPSRFTVDRYLASFGWRELLRVQPISYERFLAKRGYRPGVYLFTDVDRLADDEREWAIEAWNELHRRGDSRLLNHPAHSLRRFELLTALHAQEVNTFRAFRATEPLGTVRFPVFLRIEHDHKGGRGELLRTPGELGAALARLRDAGERLRDWLVVEFCDTADADGRYRKYAAFRVGSRIIPRHLFTGTQWCLKQSRLTEPPQQREEWDYLLNNPHRDELMRIFRSASIEYGRIDYSLLNGRIQVWEINTNPTLPWQGNREEAARLDAHRWFVAQLHDAWRALEDETPARAVYPLEWVRNLKWVGRQAVKTLPALHFLA
jgi:hypothetical protein